MLQRDRRFGRLRPVAEAAASAPDAELHEFAGNQLRALSFGTTTRSRPSPAVTRSANIVSGLPVPVGMTTLAGLSDVLQWASVA
jgi:hypothetical protein